MKTKRNISMKWWRAASLSSLFAIPFAFLMSCSPDSFDGADPNGRPTVDGVDFQMTVDQETNQMVATYKAQPGTYPVWILDGTSYSTLPEVGYKNDEAGTHTIEMKLGNRNGFSQGGIKKTYTFNETKIDYTADFRRIADKEWRIANKEAGHMGCGPAGTAATEWWSAGPDDKKGFGVYDDRITFTATTKKGGGYTYNPGADGMTYVNYGTHFNTVDATADLDVALGEQTATWNFEELDWTDAEGNVSKQRYIRLSGNTLFPYISSDDQYADPLFRVEQLTAKKLVLVYDKPDRSIAWRFILTCEAEEKEWSGYDPNSQFNMWKGITPTMEFWYAPGWSQIADPGFVDAGNDYTITLPEATTDQWQAQVKFHTDLTTNAATNYDFSAVFNSDKDLNGATVKLVLDGDDGVFYFADRIDLKAGQDYIFWKSDMPGIDMNKVMLVLDFGGCQAGTTVNVSGIVLKNHADDDGTVPPGGDDPEKPTMDWDYESSANLWKAVDNGSAFKGISTWFANDGWSPLDTQPEIVHKDGIWEFVAPAGIGSSQWQGQIKIFTTISASKAKKYNFYCVVESDMDIPGVTIKLTQSDESESNKHDDNFFFDGRHDVKADEPLVYKAEAAALSKDDAHELTLVFDFGGAPEGAHVKISKIYFEEAVVLNYDDANNLWKSVDTGDAFKGISTWFANDGWSPLDTQPEIIHNGNKWSLVVPEGIGTSQWQGQVKIFTTLSAKQNDPYNFQCTITADNNINGATIKLTQSDESESNKHDDNFYFDGRHDVKADEPFVYKATSVTLPKGDAHEFTMVFDFGGAPAGTNIVISDIIFEKAE